MPCHTCRGLAYIVSHEALGKATHERPYSRLSDPMHEESIEPLPQLTQRRSVATAQCQLGHFGAERGHFEVRAQNWEHSLRCPLPAR